MRSMNCNWFWVIRSDKKHTLNITITHTFLLKKHSHVAVFIA